MGRAGKVAVLAVALIMALFLRWAYDKLVDEQHLLHVAHGRMLIEEKRRLDLVTRCWDAVEQYRDLELKIQEQLVTINGLIRAGAGGAAVAAAREDLFTLIARLDAVKEGYPDLKSKPPYLMLMETMETVGMHVTHARLDYNEKVFHYNVLCKLFPFYVFAKLFGYHHEPFFESSVPGVRYR